MSSAGEPTLILLRRWHGGEQEALGELLERDLPWIRQHVQQRLGERLREFEQTQDVVQDAMLELFEYGPRFEMASRRHFRGLLARIIENVLRGKHEWYHRQRRDIARLRPIPSDTVLHLEGAEGGATPSAILSEHEEEAMLRLALELMAPADREVLTLRQWEGLSFAEVGQRLAIEENTARMRFNRALPRLVENVRLMRRGDLDSLLSDAGGGARVGQRGRPDRRRSFFGKSLCDPAVGRGSGWCWAGDGPVSPRFPS